MKLRLRRRGFGQLVIASTVAAVIGKFAKKTVAQTSSHTTTPAAKTLAPGNIDVRLRVNGKEHALQIEPRVTLLDMLRERIGLTGTKVGLRSWAMRRVYRAC